MNVKYITSDVEAKQALRDLEASKKIALDTETTGLDSWVSKLRLVQMCSAEQENEEDKIVYVFDMFKISSEPVKTYIESRETLVIHNANFDLQFLYSINCDYKNRIFCTFIAEKVLRAGFKERKIAPKTKKPYFADISCSLKAVSERRLGLELDKQKL